MEPAKYRETYDDSSEAAVRLCRKSNKRQSLASYHSIGSVNLANGCGSRIGRDEAALSDCQRNRHPGRRRTGYCNGRAGV